MLNFAFGAKFNMDEKCNAEEKMRDVGEAKDEKSIAKGKLEDKKDIQKALNNNEKQSSNKRLIQ